MGEGFTSPVVAGDGTLVIDNIKSSNYVAGTSGWNLQKAGNAELNNVTVRGTVDVVAANNSEIKIAINSGQADLFVKPADFVSAAPHVVNSGLLQGSTIDLPGVGYLVTSLQGAFPDNQLAGELDLLSATIDGSSPDQIVLRATQIITDRIAKMYDNNNQNYIRAFNGTQNFTFTSASSATAAITFPNPMSAVPLVFTNINNGAGATAQWHSRAINITANGFTLFVFSTTAGSWSNIPVQWSAQIPTT